MKIGIRVEGLDKVLKNLNSRIKGIEGATKQGLIAAGMYILHQSQLKVPVKYGNLRASGYVVWKESQSIDGRFQEDPAGKEKVDIARLEQNLAEETADMRGKVSRGTMVGVGYAAWYAFFVHEVQAAHQGGRTWKFLENAIKENVGTILKIISNRARAA